MGDLRPEFAAALRAFGLDAVVTLPDASTVEAEVFWLPPRTVEVPSGSHRRAEVQRVLVIPLSDDLTEVPRGAEVTVAEVRGGADRDWRVDATIHADVDHVRVLVVPA
jgi:hypothetical protein